MQYEYDGSEHTGSCNAPTGGNYNSFTVMYRLTGTNDELVAAPKDAGTYDAVVTHSQNNYYNKFEHTYTGVLTITKAKATLVPGTTDTGYLAMGVDAGNNCDANFQYLYVTYLDLDGTRESLYGATCTVTYEVNDQTYTVDATATTAYLRLKGGEDIEYGTEYTVTVTVTNLRNFDLTNNTLKYKVTWVAYGSSGMCSSTPIS